MEQHKEPTLLQKIKNISDAAVDWAIVDKFGQVDENQLKMRKDICASCPKWDASGYGGLGKCTICGCSVIKLYIPNSTCPDSPPKWGEVTS